MPPLTSRRRFLGVAATAAGAVAFTGCRPPERETKAQSRLRLAEDLLSADESWFATACRGCPAGCGVVVRVVEGRAKKVEGNPDHPLNRGKLCARGQASVQEQYHPDRLQGPLRLAGQRGTGDLRPVGWPDALAELAARLRDPGGRVSAIVTGSLRGHAALVVDRFAGALGAEWLVLDPLHDAPYREAARRVLGQARPPALDIGNARYALSIGADFLGGWLSPVHYGVGYGVFRQGEYRPGDAFQPRRERPRGYLVQAEARFSATAASADEWIPLRPGAEGLFALALGQVLLAEGLADPAGARAFGDPGGWEAYAPERTADRTGVAPDRVRALARALATSRPSLVIAGGTAGAHTNGTANLTAALGLNLLLGAVGAAGGLRPAPPPPLPDLPEPRPSRLADWQALADRLRRGEIGPVLVAGANPLHALPAALRFEEALAAAPFVASFASFPDETSALADLVLPASLPLEDWGDGAPDPAPAAPVWTLQQPVLRRFYDTRGFADVLLELAGGLGGPAAAALPWPTFRDLVREGARQLQRLGRGSVKEPDFERFWTALLQRGGWWDEPPAAPGGLGAPPAGAALSSLAGAFPEAQFAGPTSDDSFHLLAFPHPTLGAGETAHLPWLQATPEPITSAVWRSWVEVNPRVAAARGLVEGDLVALESPAGRVELPVYVSPAAPPWLLAVPMGQGHDAYGRWAQGRGANPLALLAPLADAETGALAWAATRVRMTKVGRRSGLPKLEGTVPARQLPDEPVVRVAKGGPTAQPGLSWGSINAAGGEHRWGMAVDVDRCTGCQACVVACQAENNLPLNEEHRFLEHRAKEWIRIERYWEGAFPDVKARFLPVLCQHCGNAPCEPVCPVYATYRNQDGLNVQVYNRCVGTRYCGNNCPYSVRFFNFWEPEWPEPLGSQLNPDVTVRSKGVMEKCTFCVQRINRAKREAAAAGRPLADGDVQPACAQACPTDALVFGDWLDPSSRLNQLARDARGYRLLEHLGTEPAVVYLKRVDPNAAEES